MVVRRAVRSVIPETKRRYPPLKYKDLKRTCGMMDMVCMHASTHVPWCMYLSIYLSLHPFIHLPIYLFIYPSIHVYPAFTCSLQMYELLFV